MFFIHAFLLGTNLHTDDGKVSKSTLERVWTTHITAVKIPATTRFSKCRTCERLKKMTHSGNIEVIHELSKEELLKLGNDKA